jgi:hypothetical protein
VKERNLSQVELAALFPEAVAYVFETMGQWYADAVQDWPRVKKTRLGKAFGIEGRQRADPWIQHREMLARENARLEFEALAPQKRQGEERVKMAERHGLLPARRHSTTAAKKMALRKLR